MSVTSCPAPVRRTIDTFGVKVEAIDGKTVRCNHATLPARYVRSIAVHRSFLSYYVAAVARVDVADDDSVRVTRTDLPVDCRCAINPDRFIAQFAGAVAMVIADTLYSELRLRNEAAEQSNFTDYRVARIDSVPKTHVYIVPKRGAAARGR